MKYAAFFRNLNPGRSNCPTKMQFEAAFTTAGAESASSFLTNGTLAFPVNSSTRARKVLALACQALQSECGLKESAYIRDLEYLAALDPFASVERSSVFERCVSFLHPESVTLPALPLESKRRDIEVLRFTDTEVLSVSRKVGNTAGSPSAFLEKLLGSPVTTRNWNTVVRLVETYA